jgi:hypothetical protein
MRTVVSQGAGKSDPLTAKSFRERILRPAEGVFLFHPRAIERLREAGQRRSTLAAGRVYYHLLDRRVFLERLESENPEALSVIEGLPLPDRVLLLPMPTEAELRGVPGRTLLRDYWARRFEGEVARQWEMTREDNQDQAIFGSEGLRALIGELALREAGDVLLREGVWSAGEGPPQLCRCFVARVARLRYFAPGSRGWFFPVVHDWDAVDDWLDEGGLDLPPPLSAIRLPRLLERGRPAVTCGSPAVILPLRRNLPFGGTDPDLDAIARGGPSGQSALEQAARDESPCSVRHRRNSEDRGGHGATTASRCLSAIQEGASIRRREPTLRHLWGRLGSSGLRLLDGVLGVWDSLAGDLGADRLRSAYWGLGLQLRLLRALSASAQRAEWDSRFALALGQLSRTRSRYALLAGEAAAGDPVVAHLDARQWAVAEAFGNFLAVTWRIPRASSEDLSELIARLLGERGDAGRKAQALLDRLETVLLEGRASYFRWSLLSWLAGGRLRQVLPFQGTLKALAALQGARELVDALPWPQTALDRLATPLVSLTERIGQQFEETLRPRLRDALHAAELVPEGPEGHLAAQRLSGAMAGLIRRRQHLKFSDVRDLLNQDLVALPDLSLEELWRGDRLGRFDRAAHTRLPGVYQRGEPYVKGLQRLSSPVFGTRAGRMVLRGLALPGIASWGLLELTVLIGGLFGLDLAGLDLTGPAAILTLATVLSITTNTRRGRALGGRLWRRFLALMRLLFVSGPTRLFRWRPVRRLLALPPLRRLWERLLLPTGVGAVPLFPVALLWWLAVPAGPGAAAWVAVLALAFAIGTLLRETTEGRRRLDDLVTGLLRLKDRLRHERILDLITPVMDLFKGMTRAFAAGLHRIRTRLSPRFGESAQTTLLKGLAALPWAVCEAVIRFYGVVLIEPQVNPVKHFPAVTLGHKLMLPFLPALSGSLHDGLSSFLPGLLVLPLVGATIALLPGVFGFLFWELKEDWGLYCANRSRAVPPARIGPHGETLTRLLRRGLHSGTLPRAFDGLRDELNRQIREESPEPKRLARATAPVLESHDAIRHFAEQELAAEIARTCPKLAVTPQSPRTSSQCVQLRLHLRSVDTVQSVVLSIALVSDDRMLRPRVDLSGAVSALTPDDRQGMAAVVRQFLSRCGAAVPSDTGALDKPPPAAGGG